MQDWDAGRGGSACRIGTQGGGEQHASPVGLVRDRPPRCVRAHRLGITQKFTLALFTLELLPTIAKSQLHSAAGRLRLGRSFICAARCWWPHRYTSAWRRRMCASPIRAFWLATEPRMKVVLKYLRKGVETVGCGHCARDWGWRKENTKNMSTYLDSEQGLQRGTHLIMGARCSRKLKATYSAGWCPTTTAHRPSALSRWSLAWTACFCRRHQRL